MGLEARCVVRYRKQVSEGLARLETADLRFRGDFRLAIRFADMKSFRVARGALRVETAQGVAVFELGAAAEKWAERMRSPKLVIDKLGVKPGQRVSMLGTLDPGFVGEVKARAASVATRRPARASDLIFCAAERPADLARLPRLKAAIQPAGAVWVVWRKSVPTLTEDHVRGAALSAGLVDVKVVAFSATHSALKLMIRKADR
jgi:hypothetical protein